MKTLLLLIIGFITSFSGFSQDTIFLKNESAIKAQVIEIGTAIIKYKKFDNKETSPVYSIYKSEVRMIKYGDGSVDEFSIVPKKEENIQEIKQVSPVEKSDSEKRVEGRRVEDKSDEDNTQYISKLFIGGGFSLLNRYKIGNALDFWQNITGDPSREIAQSTGFFIFRVGYLDQLTKNKKHWIGLNVQAVLTPSHAIWGTQIFFGGKNEIYFKAFFANLALTYAIAVDPKKNALIIIEPGLDIGYMKGMITINNKSYEQTRTFGVGWHGATGVDYLIGKNLMANFRVGYRSISIKETHEHADSETGYQTFFVDGNDGETVKVDWSGLFVTIGVSGAINMKKK